MLYNSYIKNEQLFFSRKKTNIGGEELLFRQKKEGKNLFSKMIRGQWFFIYYKKLSKRSKKGPEALKLELNLCLERGALEFYT